MQDGLWRKCADLEQKVNFVEGVLVELLVEFAEEEDDVLELKRREFVAKGRVDKVEQ